jgi:hypothetical protein
LTVELRIHTRDKNLVRCIRYPEDLLGRSRNGVSIQRENSFAGERLSRAMNTNGKVGRIRVTVGRRCYHVDWRVVGSTIEIASEIGSASARLGALAAAPATAAAERFRELASDPRRPARPHDG